MTNFAELEKLIKDYMSGSYEITTTKNIPSAEEVPFGKKAFQTKLIAFCIDLRKSTELLWDFEAETCCKIHKSFLTIASKIVQGNGGQIRSFNGDSLLAFWPAQYKSEIEAAICAAFQMKWALDTGLSKYFEKYRKLDFGIGIDWGTVTVVKAGLPRNDNNNDLVFLGECVNFACHVASQAKSPCHIEISPRTYENLSDKWLYGTNGGVKKNMWINGVVVWKNKNWDSKLTNWHQPFD